MSAIPSSEAEKEKRAAAFSSVLAAVFLTMLKLVVGLATGSLGILAEAAHSALDLVAALVTFFAVRLSDRPADEGHTYGHGKIENISALVETLLLLITCVWIIYEAIQRLFFKSIEVEASIWAFVVMGVSILVDINRSRMLYAAARKHSSQALEADALHFSTDIWSSAVVIVGLALVWASEHLGDRWSWLVQADAVAALGVAIIVVFVSLQLGRRAVQVLLDAAPPGLVEQIGAQASQIPGVYSVGSVRLRQSGASTFADLTVEVDRSALLEEAHQIASAVESLVADLVGEGDVVVHVDPVQQQGESLPQTITAIAARQGLRAHDIHAHEVRGVYFADFHVEVAADLTVAEAHQQVSRLEAAVLAELPNIREVHTHIEPRSTPVAPATLHPDTQEQLRAEIVSVAETVLGLYHFHNIQIRSGVHGYDCVLHCWAEGDLSVAEAHRLADYVEKQLYIQVPSIAQALVHVEPESRR